MGMGVGMTEIWRRRCCLQTLTSEGYGVPWAPITYPGQLVSMITALVGTIVLALPIAVVGLTFDEEWAKQAKASRFQSTSCVYEYNLLTHNGTANVQPPYIPLRQRVDAWVGAHGGRRLQLRRIAPHPAEQQTTSATCSGSAVASRVSSTRQRTKAPAAHTQATLAKLSASGAR